MRAYSFFVTKPKDLNFPNSNPTEVRIEHEKTQTLRLIEQVMLYK